jgi:hypothetical protein
MRPVNSSGKNIAASAVTGARPKEVVAGTAAKGMRQASLQEEAEPSSLGGQPSQSPMSPADIAAGDIATDICVTFSACVMVLPLKTASSMIARMRTSALIFQSCYALSAPASSSALSQPFPIDRVATCGRATHSLGRSSPARPGTTNSDPIANLRCPEWIWCPSRVPQGLLLKPVQLAGHASLQTAEACQKDLTGVESGPPRAQVVFVNAGSPGWGRI